MSTSDGTVPKEIEDQIKGAWVAGTIAMSMTLLFVVLGFFVAELRAIVDAWALIDVALFGGLTYGVYRKSRVCAVGLFLLFLFEKIAMFMQGQSRGSILAIVFLYYLARGVQGTFAYHSWKKQQIA